MNLIVSKFGGSSVATHEKIRRVADIISADENRRCVVLSAPGKSKDHTVKVTDLLIAIVEDVLRNNEVTAQVEAVKQRYCEIYEPLGLSREAVAEVVDELNARISTSKQEPEKFWDAVVAFGEEMNARLFAVYLKSEGQHAVYIGPAEGGMLVHGDFGDAQPIENVTTMRLAELKKTCADSIVVFPGFFGITDQGDIATFSRGGSDLTGALLAEALDAAVYENWTDVDGIFSTNPNLVASPQQIPALTYREMRELSYIGFNVLHEEAVTPAMRKKIPIRLRNTNNTGNEGTLIVSERMPNEKDVVGIACGGHYCSFTLEKFLMNRERGFGRRLLSIFEDMNLSYEHCPSGVDSISVILDQTQLQAETVNTIIRTIEAQLVPDTIRTEFGISLVAVVGEGLLHKIGVLAQATSAMAKAGVNIKMANQGSSEISMIFGIDGSDEKKAVKALYNEFFEKGA